MADTQDGKTLGHQKTMWESAHWLGTCVLDFVGDSNEFSLN